MNKLYKISNINTIIEPNTNKINLVNEFNELEIIKTNNDLYTLLTFEKKKIDKYQHLWDKYKKFTNEYEFIYTSSETTFKSVLINNKISRSYYKLWEILNDFNIISDDTINNKPYNIANIAESPGGFIEAIVDFINVKKIKSKNIFFYGISIVNDNNFSVPRWRIKKKYLQNFNINLNCKQTNMGDIYNYDDILKYITLVTPNTCELITCDGGFDINGDYENQENLLNKLLLCETYLMIKLQKKSGKAIIKCFDLFSENSMKIIYILSIFYETITFVKPLSSRPANSEKYLLCENFNTNKLTEYCDIIELLKNFLYNNQNNIELNITVPIKLKIFITEYNKYYTDRQISNINNTINLIEEILSKNSDIIQKNILKNCYDKNIEKCKQWCDKYKVLEQT
jgi:23S rRNA U2552 (ribose-2'-O)-methylase RlmE/FtsJ